MEYPMYRKASQRLPKGYLGYLEALNNSSEIKYKGNQSNKL